MDTGISPGDRTDLDPGEQQLTLTLQENGGQAKLSNYQMEPDPQEADQDDILMMDSLGDAGETKTHSKVRLSSQIS